MKGLKISLAIVLIIMASFALVACGSSEEPAQEPATDVPATDNQDEVVYKVGTDAAYPPFEFLDGDNIVGFDIDILNAAADAAGIKLEIEHTGWDPLFNGIDNGSIDMGISSITITEDRKLKYDFSNPYFEAHQLIMVKEDSDVTSLQDLAGKNIGVQTATTGNFVVQDAFGETYKGIKGYDDTPSAVDDLLLGRLDAVVVDNGVLQEYLKVVEKDGFKLVTDPAFELEEYGIIVKKDRDDGLIDKINEGLKIIKDNGQYDEIYQKYFGE